MATTRITGIRDYYRRVTEADIGEVARELLNGRIVHASAKLLECDCPNHASDSKRSLHVMLDKQGWYCFGCGIGGDVLQLVEFIQSGEVTRRRSGLMPESHRLARDYLAERAGLPPLSGHGLTPEQLAEAERAREEEIRVFGALTRLSDIYHKRLLAAPEALAWFTDRYRISEETIRNLKIGWANNEGIVKALTSGSDAFTLRDLAATGALRPTPADTLDPFFERRIVFPYWSRGQVVYMIGRKTPWTPNDTWEQGKYKKLPVHDEKAHAHIAACISNAHLFNEDVLLTRPGRIVITEGVTDCISLIERGFPAISPVTIRIREADWERILPKLAGVKIIYVVQDNELSEVGLKGALATAHALHTQGIDTRIVILPLDGPQAAARTAIRERYGVEQGIEPRDLKPRLDALSPDDRAEADRLLEAAKIDVNLYFAAGHTAEEFEQLLATARTPIELGIDSVPPNLPEEERDQRLRPILEEIATLDPLDQERYLRLIQLRFGKKTLALPALRTTLRSIQRERKAEARRSKKRPKRASDAPAGSCREAIDRALIDSADETGRPNLHRAAEAAYDWFSAHGARFFRTREGEPFMFFDDELLWMDSGDRGRRRVYEGVIYKHARIVPSERGGRIFYDVLADCASRRGELRDHLSWLHTDVAQWTVYINLNNEAREIAKITPGGIEILRNGANPDGVVLESSYKMAPIQFLQDADLAEAERLLSDLVIASLTCAPRDRLLVASWAACFPLLDFAGTRPMLRFEGPSGSGKTTASKIISTLVYGSPQQKTGTMAAHYVDAARNPMVILDNIEARQLTEDLTSFVLTCVTGITKEKRKGGTDSETVTEQPKCLLNTTGIEPLGGELAEALSRSFVVRFSLDEARDEPFLEAQLLARIRERRDLLLTLVLRRTSQVLAMLQAGAQERVMSLLHRILGNHSKRRANDFLALMYLMGIAGMTPEEAEHWLNNPLPTFFEGVGVLNEVTGETARESNPIATVLGALLNAYRTAAEADRAGQVASPTRSNASAFRERYPLNYADEWCIERARARELFVALKRFAKDSGLSFPITSVQQFVQRLTNDLKTIAAAGFQVDVTSTPGRPSLYDVVERSQ